MKKFLKSLPFRLILALIIGIALGRVFGYGVMKVVVTLQYVLGQLITFCVPLIIIGFIAPKIYNHICHRIYSQSLQYHYTVGTSL